MKKERVLNYIKNSILFIICPIITFYLLEYFLHDPFETMKVKIQFFNMLFYLLVALFFLFLTGKEKMALAVETILFFIIGLANFYVYRFRSNPILPWDIYSLRTAASVSDNYDYSLSGETLWVIAGFAVLLVIELLFADGKLSFEKRSRKKLLAQTAGVLATVVCIVSYTKALHQESFIRKMGLYDKLFTADTMQFKNGTSIAFLMELKYLTISKPEGYSVEMAEALLEQYKTEEDAVLVSQEGKTEMSPNVIVIMNEAFSDPAVLGDYNANMDYMPYVHSLMKNGENTISGLLDVSVLGGNTANTEFEFLTGDSMAFLTEGSVAYQQYIHGKIGSINDIFHAHNYTTIAMHPYKSKGWNRDKVYEYMNFDQSLFIDDFEDASILRTYVDDQSCMDMIKKLYEEKQSGQPMFVFNVTMQNHSGYDKTYDNFIPEVTVEGVDNVATLQYLSLMKKSDEALQNLTAYFAQQQEPTIIVMFGDHQPSDSVVNPLLALSGKKCSGLTEEEEYDRYKVPFVVWANYDIEEQSDLETSPNFLSGLVMETAGLPLSPYQNFLKETSKSYPIVTGKRVMDAQGNSSAYSEMKDTLNEYAILEYYHLNDETK